MWPTRVHENARNRHPSVAIGDKVNNPPSRPLIYELIYASIRVRHGFIVLAWSTKPYTNFAFEVDLRYAGVSQLVLYDCLPMMKYIPICNLLAPLPTLLMLTRMTLSKLITPFLRRPEQDQDCLYTRIHRRHHAKRQQRIVFCTLRPCLGPCAKMQ